MSVRESLSRRITASRQLHCDDYSEMCVAKPSRFLWYIISFYGMYSLIIAYAHPTMSDFLSSPTSITPSTLAPNLSHLQEIRKSLGCDESNWEECLQAASKFANIQAVYAQQIATHRKEALQRALDGPTEYLNIKVFPEKHPVLVPLHRLYNPRPEWNVSLAFADVNIAGLPKAGSTQLHKILSTHHGARPFDRYYKEKCISAGRHRRAFEGWDDAPINRTTTSLQQIQVQKELYEHYDDFFSRDIHTSDKRKITVNACYWIHDIEISWHYLRPKGKKSIFLFRDPADWLWSAFNFWKINEIDPQEYGWLDVGVEYRSPEFFHELVASGTKTKWGIYSHAYYHTFTIRSPRKLLAMFGREHVLFLRNEDMLPDVVDKEFGVLDQLSNFTGLDRSEFDPSSYSTVMNCNDKKGLDSVCSQTRSSSYASAGGREMLPETRKLIYMHFWEECKIWAQEFGVVYPDCLNVMKKTRSQRKD